jgi:hypothetical protein
MPEDTWRAWLKNSYELLACYVNEQAAVEAVGKDFFQLSSEDGSYKSFHDMRETGKLVEVVRALYDGLCHFNIRYELEPVSMEDPASMYQSIRPPADIVGAKEGTCIDLALLFAGLCIHVRLLPMVMLLRNKSRHALVIVDTKNTYGLGRGKPQEGNTH